MIQEQYNYFEECNPTFYRDNFNLNTRADPDLDSKKLITDLTNFYFKNSKLPCDSYIKDIEIKQTNHEYKRWYATVRVYKDQNWNSTFGITPDYIGASIYWAQKAKVSNNKILEHLKISRTLPGHMLFPTWIKEINNKPSWELYKASDFSINMARAGCNGYYDRFDYTVFAIKEFMTGGKKTILTPTLERNKPWFDLFLSFENYACFFKLNGIINDVGEIYDLTSFENEVFNDTIKLNDTINIPNDENLYLKYMQGVQHFISNRIL